MTCGAFFQTSSSKFPSMTGGVSVLMGVKGSVVLARNTRGIKQATSTTAIRIKPSPRSLAALWFPPYYPNPVRLESSAGQVRHFCLAPDLRTHSSGYVGRRAARALTAARGGRWPHVPHRNRLEHVSRSPLGCELLHGHRIRRWTDPRVAVWADPAGRLR